MAKYYLDFVGLNTFIYDTVGYDPDLQTVADVGGFESISAPDPNSLDGNIELNHIGHRFLLGDYPYKGIEAYKNYKFPFNLANTASFFPALMIHRNGPYGWPTWKQIRASQNPIIRKQRQHNVISALEPPKQIKVTYDNGSAQMLLQRFGDIKYFSEPPVTIKYKPLLWNVGNRVETDCGNIVRRFSVKSSLGNETEGFANKSLNQLINRPIGEENQNYSLFKSGQIITENQVQKNSINYLQIY